MHNVLTNQNTVILHGNDNNSYRTAINENLTHLEPYLVEYSSN